MSLLGTARATVSVALDARSYDIHIGAGLLAQLGAELAKLSKRKRVIVLSDANVARYYAANLRESLEAAGLAMELVEVAPGEGSKSFTVLEEVLGRILDLQPDRQTPLLALGGGVVGDLTGLAASLTLRGIPFVQVPTTLLSQVDSSVGGKTGINTPQGKNLVGSFYQPIAVFADIDTLGTLPPRELASGLAEVIKYGAIRDRDFFSWLEKEMDALCARKPQALVKAIEHSCAMKAAVVAEDEREADARALLNFGHTFGHALEAETHFSDVLTHGEAVAIGMVMAARLSAQLGMADASAETRLRELISRAGLPVAMPRYDWNLDALCGHFATDKKAEEGRLTFILLNDIGDAAVIKSVDAGAARDVVQEFINESLG